MIPKVDGFVAERLERATSKYYVSWLSHVQEHFMLLPVNVTNRSLHTQDYVCEAQKADGQMQRTERKSARSVHLCKNKRALRVHECARPLDQDSACCSLDAELGLDYS